MIKIDDKHLDKIFRPGYNRIVVMRDQENEQIKMIEEDHQKIKITRKGLFIPDNAVSMRINTGKIITIGNGCKHAKPQMHVMFGHHSGTDLTIKGQQVLIMRETDLLFELATMKPFEDRVLIEQDKMPEKIKSIYVPDSTKEELQTGTIISANEEYVPGMRVMFGKYAGMKIEYQQQQILILRALDIVAILD